MEKPLELGDPGVSATIGRKPFPQVGDAMPPFVMANDLLSTSDAAGRLGISRATMYQWLADSDAGTLVIRGQPVTIDYFQGGRNGQGRIKIEANEVERLKSLMRVRPRLIRQRRPPTKRHHYPGIYVEPGDPGD